MASTGAKGRRGTKIGIRDGGGHVTTVWGKEGKKGRGREGKGRDSAMTVATISNREKRRSMGPDRSSVILLLLCCLCALSASLSNWLACTAS